MKVGGTIVLTLNTIQCTCALRVNEKDYGVVFQSLPQAVHPFVLFYNSQPPQRCVRCEGVRCLGQAEASFSTSLDGCDGGHVSSKLPLFVRHLTE